MNLPCDGGRRARPSAHPFPTCVPTLWRAIRKAAIAVALALLPVTPLLAGPPLETEDTGMLGRGEWEIILAAYRERAAGVSNREWPVLDLSLGVGHDTQLSLTLPRIESRPQPGRARVAGLGAATLAIKRRWRTDGPWAFAVAPAISAPVSNEVIPRHSEEDGTSLYIPLVWSREGDRWSLFGQAGWRWQRGHDRAVDVGLAMERALGPRTRWLVELFGVNPGGAESWHGRIRLGLAHDLGKRLSLLGSVAGEPAALHGADDRMELGVYLGLQWTGGGETTR